MANKKKKRQAQTVAKKMERTGTHTFNVKHDDGSVFECQVDDPKRFDSMSGVSGIRKKSVSMNGLGLEKKPLICDICKERVYQATYKNGSCVCTKCK